MPDFTVTDPSGKEYTVTAPDGATQDQVLSYAKSQFGAKKTPMQMLEEIQPSAPPAAEPPTGDKIAAGAKAGLKTIWNAAVSPVAMVAGVANDIGSGTLGPGSNTRNETFDRVMQTIGMQPSSPLEAQYTEKIGQTLNDIGLTALPGVAGEVGHAARAVRAAPLRAVAETAATATANAARNAAGAVARPVGRAAQEVAGFTTGVGADAMKQAFKAGREGDSQFVANMRGEVPVDQVLADAKRGLMNMQTANSEAYATAKNGWAADQTKLDFGRIDRTFEGLQRSLNVKGHSLIGEAEQARIGEVSQVLNEWRADPASHTALGLDALKRRLDAIYPDNYNQAQAQRVISATRNAVKDTIVKQAPEYADAMRAYEHQLGMIREIEKSFSLGDKAAKDTAMRKLQSLTRNNVQTNYGMRGALAEDLKTQGGVDIMPAVAGQALNTWMPRGMARVTAGATVPIAYATSPVALGLAPFASPRIMGELFHKAGKIAGPAAE